MRKVWARIGMSFWVTEEDYAALMDRLRHGNDTLTEEEARRIQLLGVADGDSYIPCSEELVDEYDATHDTEHSELEAVRIDS